MDLSKLYALLNAVPIVTGGAQAVMDAVMHNNMTFPQAVFSRINEPFTVPANDRHWSNVVDGKYLNPIRGIFHEIEVGRLPKRQPVGPFEFPSRDFEPLPEKEEIPPFIDETGEMFWDNDDDYKADVRRYYWHRGDDGFEHPPEYYYEDYPSPATRRNLARQNNKLFQQFPKLLEAFKEWRSK